MSDSSQELNYGKKIKKTLVTYYKLNTVHTMQTKKCICTNVNVRMINEIKAVYQQTTAANIAHKRIY